MTSISRAPADDELARRSCNGDRAALDQLLRRHQQRIYALCRRLTGNDADALDATQEALITIARRIDRFDGRSSFGTWAYRVSTNACLDELRRRKRRPTPFDPTDPARPTGVGPAGRGAGEAAEADQQADHATAIAQRSELDAALAQLPEDFRVAVVLRDVLTLDYAEIATVTDVPIGTVRSRIARGRALLAKQLGTEQLGAPGNPDRPARRPTNDHARTTPTTPPSPATHPGTAPEPSSS